jgi:hypothetical protein
LRLCLRSISVGDIFELLQQGLIVLQVTSPSMKVEYTHEDIFVVGQVGHRLDVCTCMIRYKLVCTGMC